MVKVIGLIELTDQAFFEQYRSQVGQTVELYKGAIKGRGTIDRLFWNELEITHFGAYVELEFPSSQEANAWASSPEYQALVPVRSKAMKLTLFSVLA
jgi:uncharacterized protein (DUF1330 family)